MGGARIARTLALGALVSLLIVATPALSQDRPAAPSEADRATAAQRFADGERAYKAGDYARAAGAFEEANRLAPHPSASWNAAQAWERAGENARAANLYARYLREAPVGDPDRRQSAAALAALTAKLGRIEITGANLSEVTVDQRPIQASPVYVNPGTHVVHAKVGGTDVTRDASAEAGAVVSVALTVSAPSEPVATGTAPVAPPPAPARHGWHPAAFFVAGGLTLVAGALTVWSGLDTLAKKDAFDEETQHDAAATKLDEGRDAQLRTNVLIGVTAAGAIFTAVAGIWLVGWSESPRSVEAGFGPGSVALRGRF